MRLRCRVGIHLIDWDEDDGECVYCRQEFEPTYSGRKNVTREQAREDRRQAKIDKARGEL